MCHAQSTSWTEIASLVTNSAVKMHAGIWTFVLPQQLLSGMILIGWVAAGLPRRLYACTEPVENRLLELSVLCKSLQRGEATSYFYFVS